MTMSCTIYNYSYYLLNTYYVPGIVSNAKLKKKPKLVLITTL